MPRVRSQEAQRPLPRESDKVLQMINMPDTMALIPADGKYSVYCGQCGRIALTAQADRQEARTVSWRHIEWVHDGKD